MRAVLDPNILIAALLSRSGAPGQIVARWVAGEFDLVVSALLLAELKRALAYPKLLARISPEEAAEFISVLAHDGILAPDPSTPAERSPDPDDDYLLALAESVRGVLVSGDRHLLGLTGGFPIQTARAFLETLEQESALQD